MTHLNMDKIVRCGLNQSRRAVRMLTVTFAVFLVSAAGSAHAQVQLDNTIKKVETFVNAEGEVERRLVDANSVVPGDELQYTVRFTNNGSQSVDAGSIVITDVVPAHTEYLDGTAFGAGTQIWYSVDGEMYAPPNELTVVNDGVEMLASAKDYRSIRWTFAPALDPGDSGYISFNVRLK